MTPPKKNEQPATEEPKNELATIENNPELMKFYQDNAEVGAKNLSAGLAVLKVHSTGKSNKNLLANGEEPNNGWFFYTPTKEQYESLEVHVLSISEGYRVKSLEEGKKDQWNQILAGVIVNNGEFKPFIMYFNGMKLQPLWNFGKEAGAYTKRKPVPMPLFTMKVNLTTEKVETDKYGKVWVVKFELARDMHGFPLVISDMALLKMLRDAVDKVQETVDSLIEHSAIPETFKEEKPEDLLEGVETTETVDITKPANENVNSDDIPF